MHPDIRKSSVALAAVALVALTLAACDKDDERRIVDPIRPADYVSPATTPDLVISNLEWAWEHRDIEEYEKVLGEDFVFYFAQSDVDQLGIAPFWDRATEMASATRLFTGQPGTTWAGQPLEPATRFEMTLTPDSLTWGEPVPPESAGTLVRTYRLLLNVTFEGGGGVWVRGLQDFYVVPVQVDGATRYKLHSWVDFGIPGVPSARGTGEVSWGALKALFVE